MLLQRVGDLCAGAADEALNDDSAVLEDLDADQRDQRAKKGVAGQARGAMAAALAGLGPQAVLAVLPLDLDNVRALSAPHSSLDPQLAADVVELLAMKVHLREGAMEVGACLGLLWLCCTWTWMMGFNAAACHDGHWACTHGVAGPVQLLA